MFRAPLRHLRSTPSSLARQTLPATRRTFLSESGKANEKRQTWKGTALRWGIALGAVYWYNTSPLFADDPIPVTVPGRTPFSSDDDEKTVDVIIEQKKRQIEARTNEREAKEAREAAAKKAAEAKKQEEKASPKAEEGKSADTDSPEMASGTPGAVGDTAALEEEADQQGAFNPETGEINWDCPCLGGMAYGPCGEEFRAAFSCFVYSKEEPKGMECIDKFQAMQDCFRAHPEVYGEELADDDSDDNGAPAGGDEVSKPATTTASAPAAGIPTNDAMRSSGKTNLPAEQQSQMEEQSEGGEKQ